MNRTLSADAAAAEVTMLKLLAGFPTDTKVLEALIELLRQWFIGATRYNGETKKLSPEEQARTVINTVLERTRGWQGPGQIREVLDELYPEFVASGRIC